MNSLTVFEFDSQEIRFVDGKPVANDVAKVLGYADPAKTISIKVKDKNKGVAKMVLQLTQYLKVGFTRRE